MFTSFFLYIRHCVTAAHFRFNVQIFIYRRQWHSFKFLRFGTLFVTLRYPAALLLVGVPCRAFYILYRKCITKDLTYYETGLGRSDGGHTNTLSPVY